MKRSWRQSVVALHTAVQRRRVQDGRTGDERWLDQGLDSCIMYNSISSLYGREFLA